MRLALLLALLLVQSAAAAPALASPPQVSRVTIAVLPSGIGVRDLDQLRPAAIGLMNPGLGEVPPGQTWLDVSQGARAFDREYDRPLGAILPGRQRVHGWSRVRHRAASTTLPIRPGLLASTLAGFSFRTGVTPATGLPAIVGSDRGGRLNRTGEDCPGPRCPFDLVVASVPLDVAVNLARRRGADELLIAVESPPAESGDQLAIALAGPGFHGLLRSPSTRTAGYLLSTDLAPTVLERFGLQIPAAMSGRPLGSGGRVDYPRLERMEGRYRQVGKRRGAALVIPLLLWLAAAGLAAAVGGRRIAGPAVELLCLSVVLLPAVLLLTAAIEPSLGLERATAILMPVAAGAAAMRLLGGYRALAAACGLTVAAYGADMLAGSVLTPRAIVGPNPGLGARFYGIGNELESILMILVSIGTGAALTAWHRSWATGVRRESRGPSDDVPAGHPSWPDRRRAATVFLAGGAVATVIFAAGRFGADAGAAIVFPVAAVTAAALAAGRPRLVWLAVLAALLGLVLIGLIDLVSGGQTHFVRSMIGSGSDGGFGDVLRHRLEATGENSIRISRLPVTLTAFALIGIAIWERNLIARLLRPTPFLSAGMVAAAVGSVVGALTNDSGVLFIQLGVLYLGLALGFVASRTRAG